VEGALTNRSNARAVFLDGMGFSACDNVRSLVAQSLLFKPPGMDGVLQMFNPSSGLVQQRMLTATCDSMFLPLPSLSLNVVEEGVDHPATSPVTTAQFCPI
jgi:hypothetical protein